MLAHRLSTPASAARSIRVARLYSVAPYLRTAQTPASPLPYSLGSRKAYSSAQASARRQTRRALPDRYSEIAQEESNDILQRTLHFQVQGGISSMEDALTVWRALEGKYGPLRDIVFPRDQVNKLKFAPSCIALFDMPFPPDFDYEAQTLAVELPTEVPANGGPGLAAFHELLSGPSYTVDVPTQAVKSEPRTTPEDDTTSSVQHTQAFSLRETSSSNPRIVTVTGSRPNAFYHQRYASDAPRSTLMLGPQYSFARLWAAYGGFAPSSAPPNMRMAHTVEADREFVEAHAHDAPISAEGDDHIGQLILAVLAQSSEPLPPVLELEKTRVQTMDETVQKEAHTTDEGTSADGASDHNSWSPITADPSTVLSATGARVFARGQLSKEDLMEQRALAALEKARAAEAAEKRRVAELNRNTRELKAAVAEKVEKEKRQSKKQEAQRAKRIVAGHGPRPVVKSAQTPVTVVNAQRAASKPKAAPAPAASGEAPKQSAASAQRQQAQPEQRKSGILGRLLGW